MSPTALIVDDELLIRWSLGQGLRDIGFRVLEAGDGAEARALFEAEFSVVLMDYRLPDTDGVALIEELRRVRPEVPVLMMTAYRVDELLEQTAALGVVNVFDKPFVLSEVVEMVRSCVAAAPVP